MNKDLFFCCDPYYYILQLRLPCNELNWLSVLLRQSGAGQEDLCVAAVAGYLVCDVAKALVNLGLVKVCCSLTLVTVGSMFSRCLCWLELIFAVVQLPLNMGVGSLHACLS
jgi:hypothetical protein